MTREWQSPCTSGPPLLASGDAMLVTWRQLHRGSQWLVAQGDRSSLSQGTQSPACVHSAHEGPSLPGSSQPSSQPPPLPSPPCSKVAQRRPAQGSPYNASLREGHGFTCPLPDCNLTPEFRTGPHRWWLLASPVSSQLPPVPALLQEDPPPSAITASLRGLHLSLCLPSESGTLSTLSSTEGLPLALLL